MSEDEEHEKIVQALIAGPREARKAAFELPHDVTAAGKLPTGLVDLLNTKSPHELCGQIFQDDLYERWVIIDVAITRVESNAVRLVIKAKSAYMYEYQRNRSLDGLMSYAPESEIATFEIPLYLR